MSNSKTSIPLRGRRNTRKLCGHKHPVCRVYQFRYLHSDSDTLEEFWKPLAFGEGWVKCAWNLLIANPFWVCLPSFHCSIFSEAGSRVRWKRRQEASLCSSYTINMPGMMLAVVRTKPCIKWVPRPKKML